MTDLNDDIINKIKAAIREHEEPYAEGAWERFQTRQAISPKPRATVAILKWVSAAAAILVGIILFSRIFNSPDQQNFSPIADTKIPSVTTPDSNNNTEIAQTTAPTTEEINNTISVPDRSSLTATAKTIATFKKNLQFEGNNFEHQTLPANIQVLPAIAPGQNVSPITTEPDQQRKVDFWESKIVTTDLAHNLPDDKAKSQPETATTWPLIKEDMKPEHEKVKKWQPGVYLSPVFGDLGIDMGYGFSLGYAISNKLRIRSGVSHSRMSASRSYDQQMTPAAAATISADASSNGTSGTMNTTASSSKNPSSSSGLAAMSQERTTLQQVEGSLSGIDIPLELNYSISKKIYASAGVSGFVVLNDNRKYTYLNSRNVKVSVETNKGNLVDDKNVEFRQQNSTQHSIQDDPGNTPFLGFYNLSLGVKQKISKKNTIAIEPFLKVPIQDATPQSLHYKGVGVRLKFDF